MNFFRRGYNKIFLSSRRNSYSLLPYLLIGGGTASYYASLTIRARDPDARILIISEEDETPYRRSPLSKELWWYGDDQTPASLSYVTPLTNKERYVCYEADGFYLNPEELDEFEHGGIALMCGVKVQKLEAENNFVELDDGRKIKFGKCLIATGSSTVHKELFKQLPDLAKYISILDNVEDYRRLHNRINELANSSDNLCRNIIILGSGLLATELAYSLNRRFARDKKEPKFKIVQIVEDKGILTDILPTQLSEHTTETLHSQGIEFHLNTHISSMSFISNKDKIGAKIALKTTPNTSNNSHHSEHLCDHLIIATGSEPHIELAEKSSIPLDNKNGGILADQFMHVRNDIWAAGDVCSFFDNLLGYRRRCTHWQHAQITGRIAGENMTSGNKTYTHQAAFVTMFGPMAHICGIGNTDPKNLDTTTIFSFDESHSAEEELRAVVFYTDYKTTKIHGVLLYNIHGFGEEMARKLIADKKPLGKPGEYAKLFELWEVEDHSKEDIIDKEIDNILTESEVDAYQIRED